MIDTESPSSSASVGDPSERPASMRAAGERHDEVAWLSGSVRNHVRSRRRALA